MNVEELITNLKKCNPKAKVTIVIGDYDNNSIDTSNFEIHAKDVEEYIELFVLQETNLDKIISEYYNAYGQYHLIRQYIEKNYNDDENFKELLFELWDNLNALESNLQKMRETIKPKKEKLLL